MGWRDRRLLGEGGVGCGENEDDRREKLKMGRDQGNESEGSVKT